MQKIRYLIKEELEQEHLSVIRELGRNIGVKAPATKKKKEIIQDIIDIQAGRKEPEPLDNRGAPKKQVDISKYYTYPSDMPYVPREHKLIFNDSEYDKPLPTRKEPFETEGFVDLHSMGFGFLRANPFENGQEDVYVSSANIRKYRLRKGDFVKCLAEPRNNSAPPLVKVLSVNGIKPSMYEKRRDFDKLIPYYPNKKIKMEKQDADDLALRCIDLFTPIGNGQRGLIVAPPKTGKTTLLKNIAKSIEQNFPETKLIVLLIDERPEEVTEFKRELKNAELVFSTFDEKAENHVYTAERVFNRAKSFVELGMDVVILLDSITRLTRAYNTTVESTGKTLSGGLDPSALQGPKRLFGMARNFEEGGSLTVIATALVETGSRMDDVIFEEFKGTGNMEIHLSRELSERRIFPAIDVKKSGTRKDELLLNEEELSSAYKLRRILTEKCETTVALLDMIKKTKNNAELVVKTDAWLKIYNN